MGFFKRYIYGPSRTKPKEEQVHKASPAAGRTAPGPSSPAGTEDFNFHEGLVATAGPSATCKHIPPAGTAVVEIMRADGTILAMDVFRASFPAPAGPWFPLPNLPATHVRPGTGSAHQEFEFDMYGPHPIELPDHLAAKTNIGATRARVWWSCE
jgi:hypothetical protein